MRFASLELTWNRGPTKLGRKPAEKGKVLQGYESEVERPPHQI
jgi:hypothetical protein